MLAVFVHGVLAGLHALGIAYNARQRNRADVAMHTIACLYDILAVAHHIREVGKAVPEVRPPARR